MTIRHGSHLIHKQTTIIWSIISGLKDTTVIMATHTLEECEKIADRIIVIVDGKVINYETPNNLRQMFNCGYLIIVEKENKNEFERILEKFEISNSIIIEDGKAKLFLSSEET